MTRAEELLEMINEIGVVRRKSPFKGQYRYNPGQKVPVHLQMRKQKQKDIKSNSMGAYTRAHTSSDKHFRDKVGRPLDKDYKETSVKRTG